MGPQDRVTHYNVALLPAAVAIERIFSGECDTISLRRASLIPETIQVLMLVKQRLRLARVAYGKAEKS